MHNGELFVSKRTKIEALHLYLFSSKIKNEWKHTSTLPYVFMWCTGTIYKKMFSTHGVPNSVWIASCCQLYDVKVPSNVSLSERSGKQQNLFFFNMNHPAVYLIFNKMFYSVFTQLQYISSLATCFDFFYKTIFRPSLTILRYIQCVHTLWDPTVFT